MKEFATMADAVAEAAKTVDEWVILPSHQKVSWDDAILRAQELDDYYAQNNMATRYTWLCSAEGAIGVTEEKEYLAQWILLPALPYPAQLEEQIRADYEKAKKESSAEARPATKFCRNCGKKIRSDAEFCRYCGSTVTY